MDTDAKTRPLLAKEDFDKIWDQALKAWENDELGHKGRKEHVFEQLSIVLADKTQTIEAEFNSNLSTVKDTVTAGLRDAIADIQVVKTWVTDVIKAGDVMADILENPKPDDGGNWGGLAALAWRQKVQNSTIVE